MALTALKIKAITEAIVEFSTANPSARFQSKMIYSEVSRDDLLAWLAVGEPICGLSKLTVTEALNVLSDTAHSFIRKPEAIHSDVVKLSSKVEKEFNARRILPVE